MSLRGWGGGGDGRPLDIWCVGTAEPPSLASRGLSDELVPFPLKLQ